MKNIYFHIGMRKSASTTIQSFLHFYTSRLSQEHGLSYIKAGRRTFRLSHAFIFPIDEKLSLEIKKEVESSTNSNFIISDEVGLIWLSDQDDLEHILDELRAMFAPHRLHFIIYVRRVDDYIKNKYTKDAFQIRSRDIGLDQPGTNTLFSLPPSQFIFENFQEVTRQIRAIKTLQSKFDSVYLRHFDPTHWVNGKIIDDFLSIFTLQPPEQVPDIHANQPLPDGAIPYLKALFLNNPHRQRNREMEQGFCANIEKLFVRSAPDENRKHDSSRFDDLIARINTFLPGYADTYTQDPHSSTATDMYISPRNELLFQIVFGFSKELDFIKQRLTVLQNSS